ncbi:MAG: hypothetical protein AAF658_08930, partial [Myxococcota bacterium]
MAEARGDATLTVRLLGDDDPAFNPGDRVRYEFVVTSNGNVPATDVELRVPLPAELTNVDGIGGLVDATAVLWTSAQIPALASIAPGSTVTVTFDADVVLPLDSGTRVTVQGSASGFVAAVVTDDPTTALDDDPTEFVVESAPILDGFTKTVVDLTDDALVTRGGDTLRYTLVVRNEGDAIARNVVVTDPIDSALTLTDLGGGLASGSTLSWTSTGIPALTAVAPGDEVTLNFEASVVGSASSGQRIQNQGTVASGAVSALSDDPSTAGVDDSTDVFVSGDTDLGATTKVATDLSGNPISEIEPGGELRFAIVVTNRGTSAATAVVVEDVLAPEFTLVDGAGASVSGPQLRWTQAEVPALATVGPGESVPILVTVRVADSVLAGVVLSNQAAVDAAELASPVLSDADPSTLTKEPAEIEVVGQSVLTGSTKQFVEPISGAVLREARPGDELRVLITLVNSGVARAEDVVVTDTLDLESFTTINVRDGGTLVDDTVTWSGLTLDPGERRELRIDLRLRTPLDNDPVSNQALIGQGGNPPSIPTDDPALPGDSDPTVLEILSFPDLTASTKDVSVGDAREISPGESFAYMIAAENTGTGTARNVGVTDVLDPSIEFVSVSNGGSFDSGTRTVSVSLGDLAPLTSAVVVINVRARDGLTNGTQVSNQATVTADNAPDELTDDGLLGTPDSPTLLTVVSGPRLTLAKTVTPVSPSRFLRPGDTLEYRLVLENVGNGAATNVEITDALDIRLENPQALTPSVFAAGQLF